MSTLEPPQAQVRSHRTGTAAHNIKPRVPSSRHVSKASTDFGREIVPDDSISNAPSAAPSKATTSSRPRVNGVYRSSLEKRTEKTRTTTTTTTRIRAVSPDNAAVANTSVPSANGVPSVEDESDPKKKAVRAYCCCS